MKRFMKHIVPFLIGMAAGYFGRPEIEKHIHKV